MMDVYSSKGRDCTYCGAANAETMDHAPPLGLFPRPRASTLVTVPCCEACRKEWSDDDEYFRVAVANDISVYDRPQAKPVIAALLRSMDKPSKRGFSRSILDSMHEIEFTSPAGLYLGHAMALTLDHRRLERVGARIVRGLFFHSQGHRIPTNYEVGGRLQPFGISQVEDILIRANLPSPIVVQHGVFEYSIRTTEEDPDASLLLARFFESLYFLGWTRPSQAAG